MPASFGWLALAETSGPELAPQIDMIIILSPSERRVVRFVVGSPDNATSFIWKLWTQDDDAYLLPFSRSEPKFSMHGDVWKIDVGSYRHNFTAIACPNAPGWVQGPAVMYCHVPYDPTPPTESTLSEALARRNIRWLDMPPEWHLRQFVVFFANADVDANQPPPVDSTIGCPQYAIWPTPAFRRETCLAPKPQQSNSSRQERLPPRNSQNCDRAQGEQVCR